MNAHAKSSTWAIADNRAGLVNQCTGLAEAVGLPFEVKTVNPRAPWTWLPVTMWPAPFAALSTGSATFEPPWPKLAIGCGWRSIPYMLALKRLSGGTTFTVQLQDPRIDPAKFDLVVPPEHDGVAGANVVPMIGSPTRVTRAKLDAAAAQWASRFSQLPRPRVAALIGGASKVYRFAEEDAVHLATQLAALAKNGNGLMVTTSRRTGEAQKQIIRRALDGTGAFFWDDQGDNPYLGMLGVADAIVVTADSTNMITEAATTGRPVHIAALPGGSPKFNRLHESLYARGIARPFAGRIEDWRYEPLNETARVAAEIRRRIGL